MVTMRILSPSGGGSCFSLLRLQVARVEDLAQLQKERKKHQMGLDKHKKSSGGKHASDRVGSDSGSESDSSGSEGKSEADDSDSGACAADDLRLSCGGFAGAGPGECGSLR